jgi:hypothetical protein
MMAWMMEKHYDYQVRVCARVGNTLVDGHKDTNLPK